MLDRQELWRNVLMGRDRQVELLGDRCDHHQPFHQREVASHATTWAATKQLGRAWEPGFPLGRPPVRVDVLWIRKGIRPCAAAAPAPRHLAWKPTWVRQPLPETPSPAQLARTV